MPKIIVHVMNADPFVAEVEELPSPSDQSITVMNPRSRDNKPLRYLEDQALSVIFPWHRISFIEVMPDEEARGEVDLFFRT
jgi:hypothetical protein